MPETLMATDGGMGLAQEDFTNPMSDGTTIISIKYKDGILIGADGRSSSVSYSNLSNPSLVHRGQQGFGQT